MTLQEAHERALAKAADVLIYEDSMECRAGKHFAQIAVAAYQTQMLADGWMWMQVKRPGPGDAP